MSSDALGRLHDQPRMSDGASTRKYEDSPGLEGAVAKCSVIGWSVGRVGAAARWGVLQGRGGLAGCAGGYVAAHRDRVCLFQKHE